LRFVMLGGAENQHRRVGRFEASALARRVEIAINPAGTGGRSIGSQPLGRYVWLLETFNAL
jgi:hypothetical protein